MCHTYTYTIFTQSNRNYAVDYHFDRKFTGFYREYSLFLNVIIVCDECIYIQVIFIIWILSWLADAWQCVYVFCCNRNLLRGSWSLLVLINKNWVVCININMNIWICWVQQISFHIYYVVVVFVVVGCEYICMCAASDIGTVAASAFVRLNAFPALYISPACVTDTLCVCKCKCAWVRTLWSSQCIDTGSLTLFDSGVNSISILTLIFVSKISHQANTLT